MKTRTIEAIILIIFLGIAIQVNAQVTDPNNSATNFPQFVGFDGTGTPAKPLDIRNDFNQNINIFRNGLNRMQFQTENWTGLNGLNVPNANRIMIELENSNVVAAWSMLHLRDGGVSQFMRRDWFNVGTTFDTAADLMYVGLLERPIANNPDNETDAVIAWGCQDGTTGSGEVDNFRMLFLQIQTGNPDEASDTEQGREVLRVTPLGNMGVGDFSSNGFGLAQQPTHRLDVDGSGRFRQLQNNTPDVLFTGVEQDAAGDYEMNYLSFNGQNDQFLAGDGTWQTISNTGSDCDWENDGTNVWTGISGDNCPVPGNVGIGVVSPTTSKLYVNNVTQNGDANIALQVSSTGQLEDITGGIFRVNNNGGASTQVSGLKIVVGSNAGSGVNSPELIQGIGVRLGTGLNTIGLRVQGLPSIGGQNIGLGGYFYSENISCATKVYAVHGIVGTSQTNCGGWQNSNHWAGFFEGAVFSSVNFYPSDENLKENMDEFESPLEKVMELNPLQYNFLVEENPALSLPRELQHGFLASELEAVFPHLVRNVITPSRSDSLGVIIQESQSLKAVNYNGIIPINTAAIQEQQGIIQNQQNQINELQSTVNELMALVESCCAQMDDAKSNTPGNDIRLNQEKTELKQNRPNPFDISTTIDYSLAEGGEVVLAVYNDKGQLVAQLDQGLKASGSYSVLWNASNISQGVYYYSLKVNGLELVKKAVKL